MRIASTAFLLFFLITSPVRAAINGVAAVVNGEMITACDLQAETAPEAMRRGLNPKDPNQAAAIEELTKATLERMINNIILTQEAQRLKISVGDSEVDNEIQQIMSRNKMTPASFPLNKPLVRFPWALALRKAVMWASWIGTALILHGRTAFRSSSREMSPDCLK